jgi:hypothetical protein
VLRARDILRSGRAERTLLNLVEFTRR